MTAQTMMDLGTIAPRLPPGWRAMHGRTGWAICTDGLQWVSVDGAWKLYVPWFTGDGSQPIAYDAAGGRVVLWMSENGRIVLPSGRVISNHEWEH